MTKTLTGRLFAALLLLLLLTPLAGCGDDSAAAGEADEHAEGEHADEEEHAEGGATEITMTAEAMRTSGVVVAAVQARPLAQTFSAPGRVVAGLTGSARVGPLVAGRVVRLYAGEGTGVRQGAPLAEIESIEVADMQGDYLQAAAQVRTADAEVETAEAGIQSADAVIERARAALAREEQLAAENLTPRSEVEQAREDFATAQASRRSALAARSAAQASRQSAQAVVSAARTKLTAIGVGIPRSAPARGTAARFVVRSPIGGTVTSREAQLGQYVEPGTDLFEVASAGSRTVEAQVAPERAAGLRAGQLVTVVAADSARFAARIVAVAPVVEAESRTVPVRVEMVSGSLRPEAFVTVELEAGGTRSALVVPEGAIERAEGGTFVFAEVEGEPGTFTRNEVALGQSTGAGVEIRSGLTAGQRIATEGVFYLRSARQRGELVDDDH
jgi:cobalt-zinc-cadmium efflux system membrane fusion protein